MHKRGKTMQTIRLGRTNIIVSKNGFGALPIQRISKADAAHILRKAYEGGINYFDTARFYTDSEGFKLETFIKSASTVTMEKTDDITVRAMLERIRKLEEERAKKRQSEKENEHNHNSGSGGFGFGGIGSAMGGVASSGMQQVSGMGQMAR